MGKVQILELLYLEGVKRETIISQQVSMTKLDLSKIQVLNRETLELMLTKMLLII